jgi:hypothetical protein
LKPSDEGSQHLGLTLMGEMNYSLDLDPMGKCRLVERKDAPLGITSPELVDSGVDKGKLHQEYSSPDNNGIIIEEISSIT